MLGKIVLTLLVALAVWAIFFRRPKPGGGAGRPKLPGPLHFAKCPGCGTYRLPGGRCRCPGERNS